jgi:hypothetical protein
MFRFAQHDRQMGEQGKTPAAPELGERQKIAKPGEK